MKKENDRCCHSSFCKLPNGCFLLGPTGPTGPTGPSGGPTGPTGPTVPITLSTHI
ncbi:MAG: hypothetical protein PUB18_05300 [bacterium]|nr:hypothetical protein [bacterium]